MEPTTNSAPSQIQIQLSEITKQFSGVRALDGVNLKLKGGEVVALVGENGAGKSTLMKILSGVYPFGSYGGELHVDGELAKFESPLQAEASGIAIIHQELSAFPHLTVAENLFVGHWPRLTGFVRWKFLRAEAKRWLDFVGARCHPDDLMSSLSVGTQQMVEIAKVLSRESRVIIFDEPTSALTPPEVEHLFGLIDRLKAQGKAIIYISHKMEEIYRLADRIVVLRDGKSVHEAPADELPQGALITQMVGRPLDQVFPPFPTQKQGGLLLEVRSLEVWDSHNLKKKTERKTVVGPVDFDLHQGEIIGVSGLLGSGRSELLQALYGDERYISKGTIRFHGAPLSIGSPREALRSQFAFVAEDRKRQSIFPKRSLAENFAISQLSVKSQFRGLSPEQIRMSAEKSIREMRVRCFGPEQEIQTLSGGNQQKVVLGRALQIVPQIILLDEPTRGIDVGAKFEIYELLFKLAQEGKGLLVVSSDLPELIGLCHRILVLSSGKVRGIVERKDFSQARIMGLAVGGPAPSSEPVNTPPPSERLQ